MLERRAWHLPKFGRLQSQVDLLLGFLLAVSVFILYVQTLVPSVLDGDPGHFQYISAVLGISYPTGFPLYMLLGHLWSLVPIGSLAYRMNLFSAFFGALTVGLLFIALRREQHHWLSALAGSVTLAVIPPFWYYAVIASEHTLNLFLVVLLFLLLETWETARDIKWLWLSALVLGFGVTNHPTFLLLVPATIIFVLLIGGQRLLLQPKTYVSLLFSIAPLILYLYIPLRGFQLLTNHFVLPNLPVAVAQGIVSPFYENSPNGLWQFLSGQTFVKNLAGSWRWNTLFVDLGSIIPQTLTWFMVVFIVCGVVRCLRRRTKLAIWLVFVTSTFAFVTLQYVYTVLVDSNDLTLLFQKLFLSGFVALTIFAAWGVEGILCGLGGIRLQFKINPKIFSVIPSIVIAILLIVAWNELIAGHPVESVQKSQEIQAKWEAVRQYPPEQNAALMAHWGDLTPFWYLQTSETWRQDLVAIFPPTDERADQWLGTGKPLYLAGALLDWAPGIVQHYQLTAWGPLVRVSSQEYHPLSPLRNSVNFTFTGNNSSIQLLGYKVSETSLHPNDSLSVALFWESLTEISLDDAVVYLSLENSTSQISPTGYSLVVNWFPNKKLTAGQRGLGTYRFLVPKNISSGEYSLRLRIYSINESQNLRVRINDQLPDFVELSQIQIN